MVTESPSKTSERKVPVLRLVVVVAIVVTSTAVLVYRSPDYSWDESIRDSDGDGVPDESDPNPNDPSIWAYGLATMNLTINNDHDYEVKFYVNIDLLVGDVPDGEDVFRSLCYVLPDEMTQMTFGLRWFIGSSSTEWLVHFAAVVVGVHTGIQMVMDPLVISDGDILTLSITYPEDFPLD